MEKKVSALRLHFFVQPRSLYSRELKIEQLFAFGGIPVGSLLSAKLQSHTWIWRWEKEAFRQHLHRAALYCGVSGSSRTSKHPSLSLSHENISRVPFTCDFCQLKYSTSRRSLHLVIKLTRGGASEYNWKEATSFSCGGVLRFAFPHCAQFSIYLFRYK